MYVNLLVCELVCMCIKFKVTEFINVNISTYGIKTINYKKKIDK